MNRNSSKFTLILTLCWIFTHTLSAQSPEAISYQAVARDAAGTPMANQNLLVKLSIYEGAIPTTKIYEEKHDVTTSATGLFSLAIGKGTVGMGNFSTIDWSSNAHHLKVEIDPGTGYVDLGTVQMLSVPYALYAKDAGNDNDNQTLSLSGTNLSISGGNSVSLPATPTYSAGAGIDIAGNTISNTGDLSNTNEIQTLSLAGGNLSISGGNMVSFPPFGLSLPFVAAINTTGVTAFDVANASSNDGVAITGRQGGGSSVGGMSRAAIWGTSQTGYGVVGFTSANGNYAGVLGRSNDNDGYAVQGTATNGAIGGFFQSIGTNPGPALVTKGGNVGIGTPDPEKLLQVEGDLFVNSSKGAIDFGYPNNGNLWHLSTLNAGEDLQFFSKPDGSNTNTRRVFFQQDGRVGIGNTTSPAAQLDILFNSTVPVPQLRLYENGNDYARLSFQNSSGNKFWSIAGYNNSTTANERLNFYHSVTGDILSITGDGDVGVMGTPTARFHIFQRSQNVGTGLRFSDGINQDWDITHGFGLRFHYGGNLRGYINATTGAYIQSSDRRLKTDIEAMGAVLPNLMRLQALGYRYKNTPDPAKTIGFIAQDVQPLFPALVDYSAVDDLYGINYAGFSVVAVKAIQEQQALIEQQQKTIDNLEHRLEILEKAILENQKN